MSVDVLLGLQWGDEGKGKVVDVLTKRYDVIARFQGGPNAGHTLEFDGIRHVLHTIPSGIFHPDVLNVVGNGVVIDPVIFCRELNGLQTRNVVFFDRLLLSRKAHLILPTHRFLDAASEQAKGREKIGSTLKGIGPTYMDKTGRNGLRLGDIELPDFRKRYDVLRSKHVDMLNHFDYEYDLEEVEEEWFASMEHLKKLTLTDSEHFIAKMIASGRKVLAEGAQGSLLDIDFGTYPFVTSSNTITAGACTGLGIAPNRINNVYGIFKAYCTRVGSGPFPTELQNEEGRRMRVAGNEFGSTTGRPRRCGWLDLPALKYAINVNGVTELMMMKADVLSGFDTLKIATKYRYRGEEISHLPYSLNEGLIEPIYEEFPGWNKDLTQVTDVRDLPQALVCYIEFIERECGVPVKLVSVGPDRVQTLQRGSSGR